MNYEIATELLKALGVPEDSIEYDNMLIYLLDGDLLEEAAEILV